MKKITQNKKMMIIVMPLILLISIGGVYLWKQSQIEPTVVFKDDIEFEYGDDIEINVLDYINEDKSEFDDISLDSLTCEESESTELTTDEVGEYKATVYATLKKKCVAFDMPYKVVDTQYPTLANVKDIKIVEGDKVSFDKMSAEDSVDGELEVSVEGKYDVKTPGTYKLKAVAEDKNGNKTEETFKLKVNEKPKEVVSTTPKPNTGSSASGSSSSSANNKPAGGSVAGNANSGSTNSSTPSTKPKPEEPKYEDTWEGMGYKFYKKYPDVDACIAVIYDVLDEKVWDGWSSNFCDVDGSMYYTER